MPDGEEKYHNVMTEMQQKFPNVQNLIFSYRGMNSASDNSYGAYLYNGEKFYRSKEYNMSNMFDRLGGGDALMAGIIYGLSKYTDPGDSLDFAVAASVLKSSIHGDTNFVSMEEVTAIMDGSATGIISR